MDASTTYGGESAMMAITRNVRTAVLRLSAVALVLVGMAACTVRLVGDYDERLDAGIAAAHTETIGFINSMESTASSANAATQAGGAYAANVGFYDKVNAEISTLRLRVDQDKLNNRLVKMFDGLSESIQLMRTRHEKNGMATFNKAGAKGWRDILDQQYGLLMKVMINRKKINAVTDDEEGK